jgi:hypothetical protein
MNAQQYARLQLHTVKELMEGKGIERSSNLPVLDETFKKVPRAKAKGGKDIDFLRPDKEFLPLEALFVSRAPGDDAPVPSWAVSRRSGRASPRAPSSAEVWDRRPPSQAGSSFLAGAGLFA